jgi:legumain
MVRGFFGHLNQQNSIGHRYHFSMKRLFGWLLSFLTACLVTASLNNGTAPEAARQHWGVLVAGSSGYGNYRHTADVCHAYHILRDHGVPAENIITMIYDDIANDPENPFPGRMFNRPTNPGVKGKDVYENCEIDYRGDTVTAAHFLAVLTGNSTAVPKDLPVLRSGPSDDVFVYFCDHGGTGSSAFPVGKLLLAEDLVAAFDQMRSDAMYKRMVVYWESCESGSMFTTLPDDWQIYAMTAAMPNEPSWGTYCPPDDDYVDGKEIGSCLGDEFSINWLQDSDRNGSMLESLQRQFNNVKRNTQRSHVTQYADKQWTFLPIGFFEGSLNFSHQEASPMQESDTPHRQLSDISQNPHVRDDQAADCHETRAGADGRHARAAGGRDKLNATGWIGTEAELRWLYWRWRNARDPVFRARALRALSAEVETRLALRRRFTNIAQLIAETHTSDIAQRERLVKSLLHEASDPPLPCSDLCRDALDLVERLCLAPVFGNGKSRWTEAAMPYVRAIRNLAHCSINTPHLLIHAIETVCT